MTDTRPTLYLSRLLPDPVMAIVRERFQLCRILTMRCPLRRRFVRDSAKPTPRSSPWAIASMPRRFMQPLG